MTLGFKCVRTMFEKKGATNKFRETDVDKMCLPVTQKSINRSTNDPRMQTVLNKRTNTSKRNHSQMQELWMGWREEGEK